jgi:hypothetical protein
MRLPPETAALLAASVASRGIRGTARAVALPTATVQRAAGGGVTAGTAAALASALAALPILAPRVEGDTE